MTGEGLHYGLRDRFRHRRHKVRGRLGQAEGHTIRVVERAAFRTGECSGPQDAMERLAGMAQEISLRNGCGGGIRGVGIICGGPLDSARGVILSPPNLPGWNDVPIVEWMERRLAVPVRLQNDANACALAEWRFGAGVNCKNMIFLTFGTGIGAGLILNGRLYEGSGGMAGEVGHIRLSEHGPVGFGKEESFEGFCSGGGISQLARVKILEKLQRGEPVPLCGGAGQPDDLTAKAIGDAAERGDPLAREIYRISGRYLGYGLSILIDLLNPEVIVIGSIFTHSRGLLWPAAEEAIRSEVLADSARMCRIVPASLGEQIGDIAALSVAI